MIQIYNYIFPISKAYTKGVTIDFWSDEIFISKMNNLPQENIDLYNQNFEKILTFLNQYTVKNIKFKFSRIRDFISQEEILKRFQRTINKLEQEWNNMPKNISHKLNLQPI
ncbi:MAG TPA: hypothetical protein PK957_02445 [Candidatus Dojkabacteria bacterium]|nr:hypothetical protein [Candidatus Dojkabacteria bacterium]HQF36375.1 hypothetical protein [Candidatus Dojkabacteria bacterium]